MDSTTDYTMYYEEISESDTNIEDSNISALSQYFKEIRNYPILSNEEQLELIKKVIEEHDLEAKEKIINCNLRLVISIAKKFQNSHLDFLDLIQEGNLGLMKAIDMYDPSKEVKFTSYASYWIKQHIRRAIQLKGAGIRIPVYAQEILRKSEAFKLSLYEKTNRYPSNEEIATGLNIPISTLKRVESYNYSSISLNMKMPPSEESELEDFISTGELIEDSIIEKLKEQSLYMLIKSSNLSKLELEVIRLRFFSIDTPSYVTIGKKINKSGERVRQLLNSALNKLKCAADDYTFI